MNDPHLVSLLYRLASEERIEFSDDLPAIAADAGAFTARLESGQLLIEMRDHFASAFDAFEVVNPYLRAWEVRHSLRVGGRPEFSLRIRASRGHRP